MGRLWSLLMVSAGVVLFRLFGAGVPFACWFQTRLGYYVVLALLLICIFFANRVADRFGWKFWWRVQANRWVLLGIVVLTAYVHLHEPHVMRVLYDEPTHALGGLMMHWDKSAALASQGNYVGDTYTLTGTYASFRQYLFPLLVSLLHDLTGYRDGNVFVLNLLLTPAVLWLAYVLGRMLAGDLAGWVAMILMGLLPLFAQSATSGQYDVLNIVLIGAVILVATHYSEARKDDRPVLLDLGLALALLLACTRTESILYVVPVGLVVLAVWVRERAVELSGFAVVSPLFLLPNLMCNLIMVNTAATMVPEARKAGEAFFDVNNLPSHLAEAVFYFFNFDRGSTNSVALSLLGILGGVGLLVVATGAGVRQRCLGPAQVVCVFLVWTVVMYLFILTNFWGSPIDGVATRFCLPVMFVGAVCGGWILTQSPWVRTRYGWVFAGLAVWGVVQAAPMSSRAFSTFAMVTARADYWFLEFAASKSRTATMFIEDKNSMFLAHRYASSRLACLRDTPSVFVRALKAGLYHEMYVFQMLERNNTTGEWVARRGQEVPDRISVELVEERPVSAIYMARISRFIGYRNAEGVLITKESDVPEIQLKTEFPNDNEQQRYRLSLYP